jgi:hypothetical protein
MTYKIIRLSNFKFWVREDSNSLRTSHPLSNKLYYPFNIFIKEYFRALVDLKLKSFPQAAHLLLFRFRMLFMKLEDFTMQLIRFKNQCRREMKRKLWFLSDVIIRKHTNHMLYTFWKYIEFRIKNLK